MFGRESPMASAFASHAFRRRRPGNRPRVDARSMTAIDDATVTLSLDPSFAESLTSPAATALSSSPSGITPIREFEPVLNVEAAASFAIIGVVFALLQLRINAVSNAAKRRSLALEALRKAESLQLSASDVGVDASDRPTEMQVNRAKDEYESALREEMGLRTIVPGVRIVAPNDPKRDQEERAAAKRFLGWGGDEFGDDDEQREEVARSVDDNNLASGDKNGAVPKDGSAAGLSGGANFLLLAVASMLIVLLWTLSFDPMVADQIFTAVGGSPPSDLPRSSW